MTAVTDPGDNAGQYRLDSVAIRGIVSAVPSMRVENAHFVESFGADSVAGIHKMTGIKSRYWVGDGQTTADLCYEAATQLMTRLSWAPETISAVIFVSQTPDHVLPATACVLQNRLSLPTSTAAFDVNLGCSGYVYGLWLGTMLARSGCCRVLLLAGDAVSRLVDPTDRGTAMLFGDAGTATALEFDVSAPAIYFQIGTDGAGAQNLHVAKGNRSVANLDPAASDRLYMDGSEIFNFTVSEIPGLVKSTLTFAKIPADDVKYFIFHQANAFMLKYIAKKIGISGDRLPLNIEEYGNTSVASIPLLMTTSLAEKLVADDNQIVLAGFGVGYSWAAASVRLPRLLCAEKINV